ncbi:MAG: bleomycin resistance protein [Gammaproteobacteria bacterium]
MTDSSCEHQTFMVPIFSVTDMEKAFEFYTSVLGMEKRWEWGEPVDYACVATEDAELFLCLNGQGAPGAWMYLFVADVAAWYQRIRDQGWEDVSEMLDEPWGMREFMVKDPDGNVLRIGTSLERLDD